MTRKAYKTDITEAQWQILQPLIPAAKPGGHPRTANMREVVNGIFYVLRTGCGWEMLPHDLPPYSTVYYYFRRLLLRTTLRERQKTGVWQQMNKALRQRLRQQEGRNPQPSAAIARSAPAKLIADSQSVKTTEKRGKCTDLMVAS
jgi:putative transposase